MTWNADKDKLLGNLAKDDKLAYVCVETCKDPTTTTEAVQAAATKCGEGWAKLKDGTCIMYEIFRTLLQIA